MKTAMKARSGAVTVVLFLALFRILLFFVSPYRRFGEDTVEKMVDWAVENIPPSTQPYILEIGAGNATLLFALIEAGYAADHAAAIDYSADAVQLAKAVAAQRDLETVLIVECDFLASAPLPFRCKGQEDATWDLLLDKGTYDAISLGEKDQHGRSPAATYPARAASLLRPGGFFLITCAPEFKFTFNCSSDFPAACNFTEDELIKNFVAPETDLVYQYVGLFMHDSFPPPPADELFSSRVPHAVINFGGKTGSLYATIAFQKTPLKII
jgi:EEF1A lysine methyltransferase 2